MKEKNTDATSPSRTVWENLEGMVRQRIQTFVQEILEEEVTELLGRSRYERKVAVDGAKGERNGHGKARGLTMSCGTITLKRPRIRGLEERFESRILPLFQRRTDEVSNLIPELYLHGLSTGDFDAALSGLLGEGAALSSATVMRLKEKWHAEKENWDTRSLLGLDVVYLWVDGVYVKAGLEKDKACVFTAIAGLKNGDKIVLALSPGHRESTVGWKAFLRDLVSRGMNSPKLIIGDGNLGIWGAVGEIFPEAKEQRCWNHRIVNALDKLPKRLQSAGKAMLKRIPYAETRLDAEKLKEQFQMWCEKHEQEAAAKVLDTDWDRMVTFYHFPQQHWIHLRTSNIVESPFSALRLRTDAAKRFKRVDNATAVIWKMLLTVEKNFRKLNGGCEIFCVNRLG